MTDSPEKDGRPAKILVVDDEEIVLSLARDALEDAGYEIKLAGGGPQALEIIEKEYFDFILTDIRMPGCDGLELSRKAREINPSIGIIFMTGYANLNTAKDAIKEGAFDYIMKPFELNEIRQAVKNAVKKKQKVAEKTLSNELNRLSDLNQLMYAISDRQSLMRLSLGFALLQGKAEHGSIIFKSSIENEIGIIATNKSIENDFDESFITFKEDYLAVEIATMNSPFMVNSLEEHPLYQEFNDEAMASFLIPAWYNEDYLLANIALKRGPKLYGLLILGYRKDSGHPKESELKLLSITTSQMAISLENIILLEESRDAYRRLKDLQSETIQLEKMATKGQMSAEIGHELNNYLGVVTGNLSLMQRHLEAKNYDELGKYLKAITNNLDSIKKFTISLVDFSGIKSVYENSDINGLIKDVVDYLIVQSRFLNIDVEFRKSEMPIFTYADPSQLQQLLYNLINNAADATLERNDNENKKIIITTELLQEKNSFSLTICDNGVGIAADEIGKVLQERFTTKKTGHGFGLLVSRRIIENHSGKFKIDSVPGQGTTIRIDFPINIQPDQTKSDIAEPVESLDKVT